MKRFLHNLWRYLHTVLTGRKIGMLMFRKREKVPDQYEICDTYSPREFDDKAQQYVAQQISAQLMRPGKKNK